MKISIFAALFLIMGSSITCKKESSTCHRRILFQNSSSKDVYISLHTSNTQAQLDENFYGSLLSNAQYFRVMAGESNEKGLERRSCLEDVFEYSKLQTATVFVFDAITIENTEKSILAKNQYYLKKYVVSLSDLRGMNWKLVLED